MTRFRQLIILFLFGASTIAGYIYLTTFKSAATLLNPIISSENTNISPKPPQVTYTNPFQTYTIKYPENWSLDEQKYFSEDNVSLLSSEVTFTKNAENSKSAQIKIQDYNQTCNDNQLVGYGERTTTETSINKQKALKIESQDNPQFTEENNTLTVYLFKGEKTCIEISVWQSNNKINSKELESILNTFTYQ